MVSRVERCNSARSDAINPSCNIGGWVRVYNTAAAICQGAKSGTDAKVLKATLSLNWTRHFNRLAVGPTPSESTPDGRPLAAKLLYLNLPNDMLDADAHYHVSVARCKPCPNSHDATDLPRHLPTGITQYVLNNHTTKSHPVHVTADDVSVPAERFEVDTIF